MDINLTGEFAQGIEAAMKRKRAPYDREALRKQLDEEYFRADIRRAAVSMLGDRFFGCTFCNYTVNANNRKAFDACKALCDTYQKGTKGLMLSGPNGIGKNHLAAAIVEALATKLVPAYFGTVTKIKTKICDAFGSSVEEAIDSIMRYSVVCINDLGAERETDFMKELLFDLIDRMYEENRTLIITTNLDSNMLYARYGSRIVSRMLGMCDVVCFKDYDHRVAKNQ